MDALDKDELTSLELETLLARRADGEAKFVLVDVREKPEHNHVCIAGTDYSLPFSRFLTGVNKLKPHKGEHIIVYCNVGSRSLMCIEMMKEMGYTNLGHLTHGIISFTGTLEHKNQDQDEAK